MRQYFISIVTLILFFSCSENSTTRKERNLCYQKSYDYYENGNLKLALSFNLKADSLDKQVGYVVYKDDTDIDAKEILWQRALILFEMDKEDEAIRTITQYIELSPKSFSGYYLRGVMYFMKKKYNRAIQDFNLAIKVDPTPHHEIYWRRGNAYFVLNDSINAMKDYQEARIIIENGGNDDFAPFVYLALGDTVKAVMEMNMSLEKNSNKNNLYNASCLYSRMDDKKLALDYLRRAFESGYRNFVFLDYDCYLDNIRAEPEYIQLVENYKTK